MLCSETVVDYYNLNYKMVKQKLFSLSELENMLGYEREIYVNLLIADLKKENEARQRRMSHGR